MNAVLLLVALCQGQHFPDDSKLPTKKEGALIDLTSPQHRLALLEEYKGYMKRLLVFEEKRQTSKTEDPEDLEKDLTAYRSKYVGRDLRVNVVVEKSKDGTVTVPRVINFKENKKPLTYQDHSPLSLQLLTVEFVGQDAVNRLFDGQLVPGNDQELEGVRSVKKGDAVILECRVVSSKVPDLQTAANQPFVLNCVVLKWSPAKKKN